tara:strand:+ start:2185 stop:2610 length:426 start_codon:yes stop_codon:yes gene_type:complete
MKNIENTNINEFKVLGMTIEKISIFYGIFLILWGVVISFLSNSDSFTSYIPSVLGVPILIFSFLSVMFINKRKLFMHIVVLFGLVIFFGGLDFIRTFLGGNIFENYWADISKLMMMLTGSFFTIQCIKSFIHARKIRNLND